MSFPDHVNPLHGALKFPGFRAGVLLGRDDQVIKMDHTTIQSVTVSYKGELLISSHFQKSGCR